MVLERLKEAFDFVGVIDTNRYLDIKFDYNLIGYESIFVVGLGYPNTYLKHEKDKLTASMYTYGYDYHDVLKTLMHESLKDLGIEYKALVDNHTVDERKCLELTGLAFKGKNNLMINKNLGSFFFIGLVVTKNKYPELIVKNNDSCGDCTICIKACPVKALDDGFDWKKCISGYNQEKRSLTDYEIEKNTLLMGCDICQRVCPYNKGVNSTNIEAFHAKPTAYVIINDLFDLTQKDFNKKYGKHAYVWRGKTLLLRNALTILLRQKNTAYNDKIKETLNDKKYPEWYKVDANNILEKLEKFKV
ncbi:epoxyqueuosine reductase [Acholeplasma granularum]|uniref:epoxyqueuosine reductase n=1 Tax=Acholeplasma granularum TaxID=264635 RepID=UPI000470B4CD|nr:4Fe-4S double cluster binding domain-containing protein [Acholeplasma granularum]